MKRSGLLAGIGGIAFGVLTVIELFVGNPPGGSTDRAHVASFVASGHRPAVVVALYLGVLGVFGLIGLLAYLRDALERSAGSDRYLSRTFWGTGVVGAAAIAMGHIVNEGPALAAGTFSIDAPVIYLVVDVGAGLLLFAGGVLLALALITLAASGPSPLPAWLRWLTLALGIVALASPIFLPFFALLLWAIVMGVWILATGRRAAQAG